MSETRAEGAPADCCECLAALTRTRRLERHLRMRVNVSDVLIKACLGVGPTFHQIRKIGRNERASRGTGT